jgi:plasmid stabilization system protein ParE
VVDEAELQLDSAHEWWEINRTAAPNAIRDDFQAMTAKLASNPRIGRRATHTRTPYVRQVFLKRVGYFIYYRIVGRPPRLEVVAFWHSSRGKGPPI